MFRRKRKDKPSVELIENKCFTVRVERSAFLATGYKVVSRPPELLFRDIDDWCEQMGMGRPSESIEAESEPVHMVAGDSIRYILNIDNVSPKKATLFKLTWGGPQETYTI